jgi:glutathione S-transferase
MQIGYVQIYPSGRNLWASEGEVKESSKKDLFQCFKILEEELGDKQYFGDESFGYIDLALIPFYSFFYTFETLGNWSMVAEFPKLVKWGERCLQKESVSKSLSDQKEIYEAALQIKQELGIE